MIHLFSLFRTNLSQLLLVFGPATISAISDNDAAGLATYTLAGARFGYSMIFVLTFVTILLAITQEMGVRIGTVTGKGLADLIRERFGVKVSLVVFLLLLIANIGTLVANFSALKATSIMFQIPTLPFLLLVIVFAFLFITRGNYETNQKIFLFGILLYFSYVISSFKSNPDWSKALVNLVAPVDFKISREFIVTAIAVVGTTITPWGQFFVQSFVNDKKVTTDSLKYLKYETYFGAFLTNFFSFFMVVAAAATMYAQGISLHTGTQAAEAIRPFAGQFAGLLFGIGLLNAAIMGIIIVALSTAYAFSEFFGYEGNLDSPFKKGRLFYSLFLFQLIVAAIITLLPSISLFKVVIYTQSLNAFLLPVILYFLLKLTNNKEIMGEYKNSTLYNYLSIISIIIIISAALISVISSVFKI